MKILVIIPARGGSKGIPKKNIRLMNGIPLISYAISTAGKSSFLPDVYVSTDSTEIADVASNYGAKVIKRDEALAGDAVTLDSVIYDAMVKVERESFCTYDVVITMQPTSPLTKVQTLDRAIKKFDDEEYDTLISVVNKPHLRWTEKDGRIVPAYEKRLNRQQLPKSYQETGAFVITNRRFITESSRFGEKVGVYEVPEDEAIDIDDSIDWTIAESLMRKMRTLVNTGCIGQYSTWEISCLSLILDIIDEQWNLIG